MDIISHNIWAVSRSIILVAACVYLGITALVFFFQARLVYYPSGDITATPVDIGLDFEDVVFTAEDGVKLSGWFIPAGQSRGVVLFCHGNGGNISDRLETIGILNRLGYSTFIFDYRGYGESEGKPGEYGTYLDAEAAWNWLMEKHGVQPDRIVIMGRSLGGAVAAWLAGKHTPSALIIESSFTSIRDMGAELHPWLPVKLLSRFDYCTVDYLKKITCPVLVIHSPEDDLVPFSHGRRLYEAAGEPKEFLEITGSHNNGFLITGKRYEEGLDNFITGFAEKRE